MLVVVAAVVVARGLVPCLRSTCSSMIVAGIYDCTPRSWRTYILLLRRPQQAADTTDMRYVHVHQYSSIIYQV